MNREALIELARAQSRRKFLAQVTSGFSGVALAALLAEESPASEHWQPPSGRPMFAPQAKRVIWLFMRGGVSHMESFDPKPALNKYAGKSIDETPHKDVLSPERLKNVRVVAVG